MLYNVALVSAIQQSKSAIIIYIYMYIYMHIHIYVCVCPVPCEAPSPLPPHPIMLSQSIRLGSLLYSSFPLDICFTHDGVYMSKLLSQYCLPSPFLTVHKFSLLLPLRSFPANRFISTIFLDSIYICKC